MQTIEVATSSRTYDVHIACELLPRVGEIARSTAGGSRAMVVSNTDVAPLRYRSRIASGCRIRRPYPCCRVERNR